MDKTTTQLENEELQGKLGDINAFCEGVQHGLFATRETYGEAIEFAQELIETLDGPDKITAMTALQVVINTMASTIKQMVSIKENA